MRQALVPLMLAAFLGGSLPVPVQARPDSRERAERAERQERRDDRNEARNETRREPSRRGVLSRNEAARQAQRQYGGQVLSVDLLPAGETPARYRVKLLSDGNVRSVDINALED